MDFYADWCAPCKILEAEIIPDPLVQKALRGFILIRVDTDQFPKASQTYNIGVMPTLLILDAQGRELDRIAGMIDVTTLVAHLQNVTRKAGESR